MEHREWTIREYERIIDAVDEFISDNYNNPTGLDEFCRRSHYTRRSVQRALSYFNTCWRDMLVDKRLTVGAELLISTSESIKVISARVGYSEQSYFAKVFHTRFDVSPVDYRRTMREQRKKLVA